VNDVIELRGLRVSAIVGVLPEERDRDQPLLVDLDLARSFHEASSSDDLEATTNYAEVLSLAEGIAIEGHFLLLETLARRIAQAILEYDHAIESVRVRVHKLRPPVPQDVASVGVSCTVTRE
jgi:dihydroneopterin aldolase